MEKKSLNIWKNKIQFVKFDTYFNLITLYVEIMIL